MEELLCLETHLLSSLWYRDDEKKMMNENENENRYEVPARFSAYRCTIC